MQCALDKTLNRSRQLVNKCYFDNAQNQLYLRLVTHMSN